MNIVIGIYNKKLKDMKKEDIIKVIDSAVGITVVNDKDTMNYNDTKV